MKTPAAKEKWARAAEMLAKGMTQAAIAKELGCTPGRVSQVLGTRRTPKIVITP